MTLDSPSDAAAELPVHLTRFIGREREIDDLVRLVGEARLLTLTGAGGSGKTRLARETALRVADRFCHVTWVDLAPLGETPMLGQEIVTALHIPERIGVSPQQLLAEAIGTDHLLVVLDNCEHVVDACAELVDALLRACPRLVILATSREALGVASETAWLVPPLASAEAVQLFVDRARAALPTFAHTASNSAAVAEICRRLDGIPLAIELAAARVRVLTPEQIARRLDDAFRLLTTGSRTALPRHRTLRATMEWSFGLLAPREQVLMRRLSIFAGSFTLDAAEAVAASTPLEPEDVLDGVAALVDKSLVGMEAGSGEARYRLLETVRQYGIERLAEAGELASLELRYAEFYLGLMEAAAPNLVGGSNAPGLLASLIAEHDNLRATVTWAVADPSRAELALRFVGASYWYWYATGLFRDARLLVDRALALDAPAEPRFRGGALICSALTALAQGEYPLACAHFEAALPLIRASDSPKVEGAAIAKYGAARLLGGDTKGAITVLDEALAFTDGWPAQDIAVIFARFWRAWAAYVEGEFDHACRLLRANEVVARQYDLPTTLAHSLATLARVEVARGNVDEGCALVMEGLELEVSINDAWGIGLALDVVAVVAAHRGRGDVAARLLAGIEAHRERLAVALPGLAPAERREMMAELRTTLGASFDGAYAAGSALTTAEVVQVALAEAARHTTEHRVQQKPEVHARATTDGRRLRVLALGALQVFVDDRLLDATAWGSARPRELLVHLLLHPEGRTKEQVGLAFWPDASTAQLRNNFHVTLHRLRKALGAGDWITIDGERYRVDPAVVAEFDVADFERDVLAARVAVKRQQEGAATKLETALARYRGDLLDGEPVGDWHLEFRDRLQRLYIDSLMELGTRHAAEAREQKAAEAFRRVLARDELHEDALLALMRCHAGLGERSQALRAFRRFADRMRHELDAEPSGDALQLFERLQQGVSS